MDSGVRFYHDLFFLLESYGLKDLKGLDEKRPDWKGFYTSATFGWAPELYNFVRRSNDAIVDYISKSIPVRIFFDDMRGVLPVGFEKLLSIRSNYACLFPRRVTFLSDSFEFWPLQGWEDGSDEHGTGLWCVPYDFLAQAFVLKPLLLAGLAVLSPRRVTYREGGNTLDWRRDHWSVWTSRTAPESVEVSASGAGPESLSAQIYERDAISERQMIRAPWLRGITIPEYVHLAQEEGEAYLLYDLAVSRLLKRRADAKESVQDALEDISAATTRLTLLYRQQSRSLNFRGITVAVGSFMTAGAFIDPAELKGLAGGIGGATLVQGITWLRDRAVIKRDMSSDDYWFLWRTLQKPLER